MAIAKGLVGVVADETAVSRADPETATLWYRGYPVDELAERCAFEEVAYLVVNGELPDREQLAWQVREERRQRPLSYPVGEALRLFPSTAHPMDALRTGVSLLGMEDPDAGATDPETLRARAVTLLAKVPTLIATGHRLRQGLAPIAPRDDLSLAENFFHMCLGRVPHPDVVKAFDVSLTLYAEHGFNCSTFAARVVASSLSDSWSAVVAGIGALKGPLHGGANEAVMRMLVEIGDPARAEAWLDAALGARRKVMGFGHRLYKRGDSRVPVMDRWGRKVAEHCGETRWHRIEDVLAAAMLARTGIRPNLDFPSAPAYHLMGFETDLYTPIFAMARLVGWTAHIVEQAAANRLIRPASAYVGPAERHVEPLGTRVRLRAA